MWCEAETCSCDVAVRLRHYVAVRLRHHVAVRPRHHVV